MERYIGPQGEWVVVDGTTATVGLTKSAVNTLGEIVWIGFPEQNSVLQAGDTAVVVESAKAATDIVSPLTGVVIEINDTLPNSLRLLNEEPEVGGWLFRIDFTHPEELVGWKEG